MEAMKLLPENGYISWDVQDRGICLSAVAENFQTQIKE